MIVKQSSAYVMLYQFYKNLKQNVLNYKNNLIEDSVLLTLLNTSSNKMSELLHEASIDSLIIDDGVLNTLVENNLVRRSDFFGQFQSYVITAFGIWNVEKEENIIDISKFLKYIQDDKFSSKVSKQKLNDKEKIVLFSLISMRNFSSDVAMDLNRKATLDYWTDVLDDCNSYLFEMNVTSKESWKSNSSGNEHPVSYLMRRANKLPQKSRHIYQASGNKRYYLDIVSVEGNSKKKLAFVFGLIFDEIRSLEMVCSIHNFLCDLANDKGKYVRKSLDNINSEWDDIIEDALKSYYHEV